jgi:Putative Actinobacterial Holin-X, holin superfamily III
VTAQPVNTDPDNGIPDLIRRLSDDSRRLVSDEVRLAKLQAKDGLQRATRGVLWFSLAFGASVVMFVALTLFLATLIGRAVNGHMWLGALVTGVVELLAGALLIRRGIHALTEPSLRLEASRATLADTANWASSMKPGTRSASRA